LIWLTTAPAPARMIMWLDATGSQPKYGVLG
jgi:hypothetical protein